jgi:hypothetical protein
MTRTLIPTVTAAAVSLVLILSSAGCGFGELTPEGEIAKTTDDYLRSLADSDTGKACAQLTDVVKSRLRQPCREEMDAVASRVGADALTAAADEGVKIDVDGNRGSAEISRLGRVRLGFIRVGERWRIASGHSLEP